MDDQRIGALARAVRRKLGWRQADVAARAGVSQTMVSMFERGRLEDVSLRTSRRIASALDVRLDLVPRWRGGDVDRLLDERHAAMVEAAIAALSRYPGWQARAEVTFSSYGDRGSIDVFAWNEAERAVLLAEIKSDLVAIEGTLRPLAVKRRLAPDVAERELGWRPTSVGVVLVLPEASHHRERVASHRTTFASVLPERLPALRRWLREPRGTIGAIWFLSLSDVLTAKLRPARRIRRRCRARPRVSDVITQARESAISSAARPGETTTRAT
jgi:HTH-type transcriptional regulator / antitoxin HipB